MVMLWGALSVALAGLPSDQDLVYEVRVGAQVIGTRTAHIHWEADKLRVTRVIESFTDLKGTVGPVSFAWQQRLTISGTNDPASFHSVVKENGAPREVQGRWDPVIGWTITTVSRREALTRDVPSMYVDLSTADLIDPGARQTLLRLDYARILTAETGDVFEGAVEPIGDKELTIGGKSVPVEGVAWMSPEGRTEFWYSSEGYLVQYRMRVLGFEVEGVLQRPPPPGLDEFPVPLGGGRVQVSDL